MRHEAGVEFVAADSDRGRRLLEDYGIDAARLPVAIHASGHVLCDPTLADLAASHGVATRPSRPVYDLEVEGHHNRGAVEARRDDAEQPRQPR